MASKRRMGSENSATRAALLDAVETVMREEGYAALSARTVAERAGLKHQLVYYYFETLDDLLLATYRRHTGRHRDRLERALQSDRPLHAYWETHADLHDAALNMEFMAMANHNAAIRRHTIEFGETIRREGLDLIGQRLRPPPGAEGIISPFAVTLLISSLGSVLGLDSSLGLSGGHPEARALIEWCLDQLEPEATS